MADEMRDNNLTADDRGVAVGRSGNLVEFWKPLMWTAIVGGTVTALGVQLILTLLGIGLGASMIDPVRDADPARGVGMGAVVWLIVSGIISFGVGGWVAGYMSGVVRTGSGALHGILAWSLAAVLGASITALAGSPVLGGAAAGTGAAASNPNIDRYSITAPTGRTTSTIADPVNSALGTNTAARDTARPMTEAEARQAADDARRAIAKASLWTGVAFILSMISAGVGGTMGRRSPADVLHRDRAPHARGRGMQPAM